MPRKRRPYLPGAVFHLNARTQDGKPRFEPEVRSRIVGFIGRAVRVSDARLLAYAVMSNHLHVVLQQGTWPLGRIMQPILRQTALLVHSRDGTRGHVFERRYHERACMDPYHVRNAIVYARLNPVRAGMVDDPSDFPWSSHALYAGERSVDPRVPVDVETGLRLFGPDPDAPPQGPAWGAPGRAAFRVGNRGSTAPSALVTMGKCPFHSLPDQCDS